MLENVKIKSKLLSSFIIVALIAALIGWVGYRGMKQVMAVEDEFATNILKGIESLDAIIENQAALKTAERTLIISGLGKERAERELSHIEKAKDKIEEAIIKYEILTQSPDEAAAWKVFIPQWQEYLVSHEQGVVLLKQYYATGDEEIYKKARYNILETTS